jgi:hypothetical protein
MAELRPYLRPEAFLATIRQQEADRYRLYRGFDEGKPVVLAGCATAPPSLAGDICLSTIW